MVISDDYLKFFCLVFGNVIIQDCNLNFFENFFWSKGQGFSLGYIISFCCGRIIYSMIIKVYCFLNIFGVMYK